jgi:SAM-dependent methyltransferase
MSAAAHDVGPETLERISEALPRYNAWMFELLAPYVGNRILEVGSGIGNLSEFLVDRGEVCLTDTADDHLATLRARFGDMPGVRVLHWDLGEESPPELAPGSFDTIVCINVLEHVEDDPAALARLRRLLAPGARLILLVPAGQVLYNEFDRALGHYRRYSRRTLTDVLEASDFAVDRVWYFNPVGIFGWFVNGSILRKRVLPTGQMRLLDRFVPVLRFIHRLGLPFGLSVVAIARKEPSAGAS